MSILTAILAHAGHVALYVTRIEFALIEWRREQTYESVAATNQVLIDSCHGALRAVSFRNS